MDTAPPTTVQRVADRPAHKGGSQDDSRLVDLDDDLGFALGVVFRAYRRTADALVADMPGGARGFQVLSAAAQELALGQGALAQRLGIDKTVMTYLVDDLERAGLVSRCADLADRRNKRIVATEHGRAVCERTQRELRRGEDHVLAALEPADRAVFRKLLRHLAARAQNLDPVDDRCQVVLELDVADRVP